MKKKGFFSKLFQECDVCGSYFGKHDIFIHTMNETEKGVVESIKRVEEKKLNEKPPQAIPNAMPTNAIPMPNSQLEAFLTPKVVTVQADVETQRKNAIKLYGISPEFWTDFDFWLQAMGFMTYRAMKYQEWPKEKILKYVNEYLGSCIEAHINKK